MSRLTISWDGFKTLKVDGIIDELAIFEPYVELFGPEVWIDLQLVTRINSGGVRQWAKAITLTNSVLHYINTSPPIIDQISMIPDFLGSGGVVDSFFANYICNHCGHEHSFCFEIGTDIEKNKEDYGEGPIKICPKCASNMEIDHNPDLYFEFLKVSSMALV